jgi:uncharacterized protein (TIGR03083 family)
VSEQLAAAYRETRARVITLARDADPAALEVYAPAAPEWRVRDLLAHLSGVAADITTGNLDGVTTDAWTAAQVDARRDRPVDDVLAEWDDQGAAVDELVPQFPELLAGQLVVDTATHEHDIRGALDAPGARDADAIALTFPTMVRDRLVGLRLDTEHGAIVAGPEPTTTVRAPRFEFFRAMTGRRSLDQIRAYHWGGEPNPEALVLSIFTPRTTPLVE